MKEGRIVGSVFSVVVVVVTILMTGMATETDAGTIKLTAPDFHSDGGVDTTTLGYYFSWGVGSISGREDGGCLQAPVKFPSSAVKVKSVITYVSDESASFDFWVELDAVNMVTGDVVSLGNAETSGTTGGIIPLSLPLTSKNLSTAYQYWLGICVEQDISFYGAKIVYTTP